jgi:hypothetical protein
VTEIRALRPGHLILSDETAGVLVFILADADHFHLIATVNGLQFLRSGAVYRRMEQAIANRTNVPRTMFKPRRTAPAQDLRQSANNR